MLGHGRRRFATEAKSPLGKVFGQIVARPQNLLIASSAMALMTLATVSIVVMMPQLKTPESIPAVTLEASESDILGLEKHIYTEADLPFFNESVPEYRSRIAARVVNPRTETIFVAISSFRDNYCQDTLQSLFSKAKDPSRVFVGVVDQMKPWDEPLVINETLDMPCESKLDYETQKQVRLVRLHYKSSRGPTHARYISSKLWDGEEVFLQIDAHAKFLQNWDEELLANIHAMPDPDRAILSHYPAPDANDLGKGNRQWNCKVTTEWAPPGLLYQIPDWCRKENMADGVAIDENGEKTTCYTPFIGAGFLAGRSKMLYDAPYDQYLPYLFHGEEILYDCCRSTGSRRADLRDHRIGARLWTSGWDLFTPRLNLVTHLYGERRHSVYSETPNWDIPARLSEARARIILQSSVAEDEEITQVPQISMTTKLSVKMFVQKIDRREIDALGMGVVRPLSEYLEYAGVDWSAKPPALQSRCSMKYDGKQWIPVPTSNPA